MSPVPDLKRKTKRNGEKKIKMLLCRLVSKKSYITQKFNIDIFINYDALD